MKGLWKSHKLLIVLGGIIASVLTVLISRWRGTDSLSRGNVEFVMEDSRLSENEEEALDIADMLKEESSISRQEISAKESSSLMAIHVSGAVHTPDIVIYLPVGSRVIDAVKSVGGAREEAALFALNLAKPLSDGERVYIPTREEVSSMEEGRQSGEAAGESRLFELPGAEEEAMEEDLTNINSATKIDLMKLPGIGEVLAERIVRYREENGSFQTIEDIQKVKGIGSVLFESIRTQITAQ